MPSLRRTLLALASDFLPLTAAQTFSQRPATIPPESAIQKADKVSTGNPFECPASTKFFPQVIDHATFNGNYNDSTQVFLQQYQVNDTFYKPGGPIFFYQGTESGVPCVESLSMMDWAIETNALMIALEHRYFGISCPLGLNCSTSAYATWPKEAYKPLNLDNVFGDGRSFTSWIKTVAYPETKDAKVLAFSGSYGGILTLLWRIHFPDFIYAAIPASPVTKGLISDPKDPLASGWGDWSNMVYSDYSPQAASIIKQGFNEIRERMATGNYTGLEEQLHLCSQPNSTTNINLLMNQILNMYVVGAQQSYVYNKYPFKAIINATLALAHDPVSAIGAAIEINLVANNPGAECLKSSPSFAARDPFFWLRCTQIPYPNGAARAGSIWGVIPPASLPQYGATRLLDSYCQASWGQDSIQGGEALINHLGLDHATLVATSRTLLAENLLDPTTVFGQDSWNPGPSRNHSRIMYAGQSAHGEVYFPQTPTDSGALVEAREYILNSIKEWLA